MASTTRVFWFAWSAALSFFLVACGGGGGAGSKTSAVLTQPDFSITMPAGVSVAPDSTQTITISIVGVNGFSGATNISISGLPTGVTATPATFTLTPAASQPNLRGRTTAPASAPESSQTVVVTAGSNALPGPLPLTIMAMSGSITHIATTSTSQADFALAGPAANVALTGGATAQITFSADAFNGFSGPIAASLAGLPAGVTASQPSFTLAPAAPQTIVLTAAPSVAAGPATLTLQGTSGALSHNVELSLVVSAQPAAPDFSLTTTSSNLTLQAGGTPQSFLVAATALNGFTGPVNLLLDNLPPGVSGPSSAVMVQPGTPVTIALSAMPSAAKGTVSIAVAGTAGAIVHSVVLTLTITPAADFAVGLNPTSLTLTPGGAAGQVAVTMAAQNGFTGSASVTLSGLPNGVAAQPSSFVLSPGGAQTVSFSAGSTNQAQTGNISFTAVSTGLTHTATLPLTITQPSPSFSLQVAPGSLTLTQGGAPQTLSITANPTNGFSGQVNLSFSGSSNITVTPSSVALAAGSSQTVNVSAAANATAGANNLTVTGMSGVITQSSSIPVTVNSSTPDFTLSVYPAVMNLTPGPDAPAQPLEILATPFNNFSEPIAVTFTGLPASVQWSGGALPLAPGIPQETQLVENGSVVTGSTIVTVTATSSSVTHSAQFTVNTSDTIVPDFAFFAAPTALLLGPGQTSISIAPDGFNGFTGQISTELTGLPAGASANFSSGELTANTGLALTITVPPGTAPGAGVLALKGTAGALTHEIDLPYSVMASPGIREYAGPAALTLNQGSTENILLGGETTLAGNITTTANPLPTGVTSPFFSPAGFSFSGNEVQGVYLPLTAATTAPVGQTMLIFTSTDGTNTTSSQVELNVVSEPNFTLSAPPSVTVPAGGTGTFSLEAIAINGFSGTVVANLSGMNGLSASPSTITLTPGVAQQITVSATAAASGNAISVAATAGTLSQSLQVPIALGLASPDFMITEPNGVLQLGTYVDSTFQISTDGILLTAVAQITGFPPGLKLAEAQDPYGDTDYVPATTLNYLSANCPGALLQPCMASYFSIAYDGVAAGTYPLTVTATWGSITHTMPLTLVVVPPDFTVSVSPQSLTIVPGTTQSFTANVQLDLNGSVTLALENLPDGVTTGGPVNVTTSGEVTLGLIASPQAAPGSAVIALIGTSTLTKGNITLVGPGEPADPTHTLQIPLTIAPTP